MNSDENNRIDYKGLDKKEHPLRAFYPLASVIYSFLEKKGKNELLGGKDVCDRLDTAGNGGNYQKLCGYKTISYILVALICTAGLTLACFLGSEGVLSDGNRLKRAEPGDGVSEYELNLYSENTKEEVEVTVSVSEQKCDEDKLDEFFEDAIEKLKTAVIGNNPSADEITGNISLVKTVPGTSVKVSFDDPDYTYVYADGTVRFENVTEPVIVMLTAELTYFDEVRIVTFPLRLVPRKKEAREVLLERTAEELKKADGSDPYGDYMVLPGSIDGEKVGWNEKKNSTAGIIAILGLLTVVGIIPARNAELKKMSALREKEMMRDYPDIISKLSLLITAGMTCQGAWKKVCTDYATAKEREAQKKNGEKIYRYAYEEMRKTLSRMDMGESEAKAYEEFGNRCGIAVYQRLGSLLSKNVRRGSRELTGLLQSEAQNALEDRRQKVRQQGEEVGTKLLLPMFGMFGIVIAIVVVPAIRSMGL